MAKIIGIAGDSGTGKTTIARHIAKYLGAKIISLDDYHKYGREERKKRGISPLNPKANDFELMHSNLKDLKSGKTIMKPLYDHKKGKAMAGTEQVTPEKFIIAEGLMPFRTKKLKELVDFKIFIEPNKELQILWKLKRDSKKRNYKTQFDFVERIGDFKAFVLPQKKVSDAVISQNFSEHSGINCRLELRSGISMKPHLAPGKYTASFKQSKDKTEIFLDGNLKPVFGVSKPVNACSKILSQVIGGTK